MTARRVLSIDPDYGKDAQGNACVLTTDGIVLLPTHVWSERHTDGFSPLPGLSAVVVEKPQQDERSRAVPPAVLIELAWTGAALAYRYAGAAGCPVVAQTPTEWKGNEPKPVMHARLWRVLTPTEREIMGGPRSAAAITAALEKGARSRWAGYAYPRAFKFGDLLDSLCINATYTGRLKRA